MKKVFIAGRDEDKKRLDKFLSSQLSDISRSKIASLIKKGFVKVNQQFLKGSYLLSTNDKVEIKIPEVDQRLKPYNKPVTVLWEDESLLAVYKPQGLVVHPHGQNKDKTLINALLYKEKQLSDIDPERPGVVHRLDKETSGVIILAKNNKVHKLLVEQFKNRQVQKEYYALVWGQPKNDQFEVNLSLRRNKKNRLKMEVGLSNSKSAHTKIKVLQRLDNKTSLLSVSPKTGRMHQIRVHLSFLGYPIAGDKKYGKKDNYKNLFLHAYRIKIKHPIAGNFLEFKAELPEYFKKLIQ
ncbi:MAG: RluA family pseudouridine synthase [Candidatus Omnitrophica bacterium]|nr:RluA family pseudouridine synthase [Candidatus Omnitrophota bacterium]MCF7894048.1 RluA family pseudouridine synthase [Candidatus Omnitrophota bacterium]